MINVGDYVLAIDNDPYHYYQYFIDGPLKVFAISESMRSVAVSHKNGFKVFCKKELDEWRGYRDKYSDDVETYFGKNFAWLSTGGLSKVDIFNTNIILPDNSLIIKELYVELNNVITIYNKKYIIEEMSGDKKTIWVEEKE